MARFTIYSPTGVALYEGTPTFTGQYMKPGLLEFREVALPALVDIVPGCYVDYTRVTDTVNDVEVPRRFKVYTVPQLKKQARSNSYGGAFVYQSVQLYDASKMLEYCPFRDLVAGDNHIHFSTQPSISTFEGCDGLARRFEACLVDQYGANSWAVRIATQAENPNLYELMMEPREFTVSGMNILECLNKVYEIWPEVGWIYKVEDGKDTIVIGGGGLNPNEETYAYGKGFGLTSLTRVAANAEEIANRIFAYGSSRNMLPRWYNNQDIKDAESVDIQNLMIPVSEWGLTDGERDAAKAYVEDDASIAKNGLRPSTVYFDGSGEYPEIYPTLRETTIRMVRNAIGDSTAKYYPSTTIYTNPDARIDKLLSVQPSFDSGKAGEDGKQSTFSEYITVSGSLSDTIPADTQILTTVIVGGSESPQSITFGAGDAGIRNISMPVSISGYIQIPGITGAVLSAHLHRGHPSNAPVASGEVELTPDSSNPDRYNFVPVPVAGSKVNIAADTYYIVVELTATFDMTATATAYSYNYDGGISVSLSYYRAKTFNITIRQVGFDIGAQADLGNGKTIAMRTGDCVGRSFAIKSVQYNSANDCWDLECWRTEDESLSQWFPNSQFGVAAGDEFVLLDIAMPDIYIEMASEKLLGAARELLADSAVERWQYTPEIDAKYMVENSRVINAGEAMTISDSDIIGVTPDAVIVDTITINEGESAIPTYKVTLRDRKKKTWTESQSPEQSSSKSVGNITDTSNSQSSSSSESKYFTLDESGNITLKPQYQNLWVPGWMAAGGVGGDTAGGGIDLGRVWDSLTNTVADQYANTKINSAHIPIGGGLAIDSQTGLIYVTGLGTVSSVAGVSPVNGDVPIELLQAAIGIDALGTIAQSLQSQIDSIAARDNFDELTVTSLFADVASIRDIYAQSVDVDGLLLTNDGGVLSMNGNALLSALANEGNNIAITVGGKELTLTVGYATVSPNTRFTYTADGETHTNVEFPVDWFIAEQVSGSYRLRLNPKYIGMYADGWIAAGGIGSGSGGGGGEGTSLVAVWRSLTNNPSIVDADITSSLDIAATHIPIGNGLSINQTTGLIDVNVQGGVTSVVGLTGDVTAAQIASALGITGLDNNLTTISDCIQSLQSQIDAVATRDMFDELTASVLSSDIASVNSLYVGSISLGDVDIADALSSLSSRSTSLESRATALEGRATALEGRATTLEGYFTDGSANSALCLTTVSKTAWGQTYWTSGGVPDNVSGDMSSVGSISMSGSISGATTITASGLVKTTNYLQGTRLYLTDDVYLEYDASSYGVRLVGAGFWTESYVSSGAPGSSSGSGVDLDRVWESLTNNTDKPNVKINVAHIPDLSWGMITSGKPTTISGYGITDAYTKTQVDNLIGSIEQFHYEIYASTSAVTNPQSNVLYLIGPTGSGSDKYEEYVYANSTWTKIGDTSIDLTPYLTISVAAQTYQPIISDLATIRSNAANGNTAFNDLSTVSTCLQSLQSQIDSVATRDEYGQLTITVLFTDTLAASSVHAGSIYIGEDDLASSLSSLSSRATALEGRATALEGRATTLESYFTNGVANSALRLSGDTAYSIWGVEYWASGVPKSVTGRPNLYIGTTQVQTSADTQNLTGIGTISASGLATILGGISLGGLFDNEDSKLVWDANNNAWHLIGNFYADGYVASGGPGSSSGSGVDLDRVWESLTNNTDKPNVKINESHIPDVASVYGYIKGNQTITLTGIVTGSGTTSIATSIADGALSIAKVNGLQAALDSKTGNTGTVTSVSMTVPTGLSVSGTPITTSGTLAISFAEGYSIPTTTQQSTWSGKQDAISDLATIRSNAANGQTAYSWGNHASVGYLLATTAASTYQPIITDLSTIRSNAANGNTAYGWGNHANAGYLTSANGTTISDCLKSLQSQIDSVASKNDFDELGASAIHSDIVTATTAYISTVIGSLSGNATTASYLVSSSYGVGGGLNPVYFSGGLPVASTSTAGSASVPVYMNGGTLTAVTPSSMFSALSSSAATNLSVTIAGQNRTISDLYARYDKDGGEIAPNMTAIGSSLRSLQSQIDSVATKNNFDELTATMFFSNTISVGENIDAGGVIHSITGIYSDGYVAAGGVGSSSDRRLKDGLSRISSDRAISILMRLKPMEWTWNDKNEYLAGKNGAGLVAQDVADIVPFAVMDCGDYLSLNYSVFHAYEIASIQDHESRIKSLEKENAMLKEKVKQLEAR